MSILFWCLEGILVVMFFISLARFFYLDPWARSLRLMIRYIFKVTVAHYDDRPGLVAEYRRLQDALHGD